ncbi:MAG: hypothetical protein V3W20_03300 [Candidatus Neomarinimicrobiota bacterium]
MVDATKLKEYKEILSKLLVKSSKERTEHSRIQTCISYLFKETYELGDDNRPLVNEDGTRKMISIPPLDPRTSLPLTDAELAKLADTLMPEIENHITLFGDTV